MRISFLRHNCNSWNLVVLANAIRNGTKPTLTKCPFYYKKFNAHWFTFMGFRLIIGDFK